MLTLGIKGEAVAKLAPGGARYDMADVLQGVLDVFRNWWLTLCTAVMGTFIGMISGLGGDARLVDLAAPRRGADIEDA